MREKSVTGALYPKAGWGSPRRAVAAGMAPRRRCSAGMGGRVRFRWLVGALLAGAAAGLLGLARPARACSAFLRDGPSGPIVAKGYDWHDERGLVVTNKRGVSKRALV